MPQIQPESSVDDKIFSEFQQGISIQRLRPYRKEQPSKKDALALYMWNMAICESLYPVLQCIEVTLRNTVHDALSNVKGTKTWYEDPHLMLEHEQGDVIRAKGKLDKNKRPHDHCRVVAELTFGFWASLFSASYEQSIVIPIIPIAFKLAPKRDRTQHSLSSRIQQIRDLRNRVFHHEPIWQWNDLMLRHQAMLELLEWLCPVQKNLLLNKERFVEVHNGGWEAFRDHVDWIFLLEEERRTQVTSA